MRNSEGASLAGEQKKRKRGKLRGQRRSQKLDNATSITPSQVFGFSSSEWRESDRDLTFRFSSIALVLGT